MSGDENVDHGRRNFLRGIGAAAAASAITLAANLSGRKDGQETPEPHEEAPYAVPIENLSLKQMMMEIVADEHRIVRLRQVQTFADYENPENFDIEYFLERFRREGRHPSQEEIAAEIDVLTDRVAALRARRDELNHTQPRN